jgi:hypothetical protein
MIRNSRFWLSVTVGQQSSVTLCKKQYVCNIIFQHPVAMRRSVCLVYFSVNVQVQLFFTLLLITENICTKYFILVGHLHMYKLVLQGGSCMATDIAEVSILDWCYYTAMHMFRPTFLFLFFYFLKFKSWATQNFITIKTSWNTND